MKKILVALSLAFAFQASAQTPDTGRMSQYLNTLARNNRFMGSVALRQNGKGLYEKAVGMADVNSHAANTPQTLFRIGSVSKTFTAALILKAAEEGKLKLSDPLKKYFPMLKVASTATIAQTLQHRSGIHNFTSDTAYLIWSKQPHTEAQLLRRIDAGGRDFPADSAFSYSNSGYALLTFILEKVYRQPYEKLLEKKITQPLGLTHTGVYETGYNQNHSYRWTGSWIAEPVTDLSVPAGAGNILSTPADLVVFFESLFSGKIVNAASMEQMKTLRDHYGMGLFSFPFNTETGYGHTGGIDGYHSMAGYFPESKTAFAVMANGLNYELNDVVIALLKTAHGIAVEIPEFMSAGQIAALPKGYEGVYSTTIMKMKITVRREGENLTMQATGQSAFTMVPLAEKDSFAFAPAGIKVFFKPEENTFLLQQGGAEILFTKESIE